MICPFCRSDMIVVERNKIELDYCTDCGGSWFDSGELELLLATLGVKDCGTFLGDVLNSPEAKTAEKHRRCPVCAHKMRKAGIGQEPRVLIDACPRGDGIWFDGGELDRLLTEMSKHPMVGPECDRKISDFLGDMLHSGIAGKTRK